MVKKIDVEFEIGQVVYLKTDPNQLQHIVYGYTVYEKQVLYRLCCGADNSEHYWFEISTTPDLGIPLMN